MKINDEQQLIQLKISCFKMLNGLIAFVYISGIVWAVAKSVQMITG